MKRMLLTSMLALLAASCDSETMKTYELNGYWTFSGVSELCTQPLPAAYGGGKLDFERIAVKVYKSHADMKEGIVYTEASTPCDAGSFTVDGLEKGTYLFNVQAMAQDPDREVSFDTDADGGVAVGDDDKAPMMRAYYETTKESVVPTRDDEPVEFEMKIGTGSIEVSWGFEDGQCNSDWNAVDTVEIQIVQRSTDRRYSSDEIPCTESKWVVDDLIWDIYTVTVKGYDADGYQTHVGSFGNPVEIRPGTHIKGRDGLVRLEEVD